ncbi:MAG: TIGR02099 family protein [Gammaproteobacteria bacterium 28-57-27]|nr:MAG: TIGR02099 family protein [Gammaproteobacteria bacterium 28-57-27]
MQPLSLITVPLRFARRVLLPLLGMLIILLAVLLSVARLALPLFDEQARSLVERAALERGLALEVERLSLDWEGLGPRLSLHNTRIQGRDADDAPLQLQTLSLHFDLPQSLISGRLQFGTLEISGLVLRLQRDKDARWSLSSIDPRASATSDSTGADTETRWPAWMGMAQRVVLHQGQLHVVDAISGLALSINQVDAVFAQGTNAQGQQEQRFALKMQLPKSLGDMVELRARLQGSLADLSRPSGELWLDTPQLKLPGWRALFTSLPNGDLALPVALSDLPQLKTGELGGQTWLNLHHGAVIDVQSSLDLSDVSVKRPQLIPERDQPPVTAPNSLASHINIHLRHSDTRWTLDLDTTPQASNAPDNVPGNALWEKLGALTPRERVDASAKTVTSALADTKVQRFSMRREGDALALAAKDIDLGLLRPWLIATPILPEEMRRTLQRHRPLGMVQDMSLHLDLQPEPLHAQGSLRVTDLGWQGTDSLPGMTGLDAQIWLDGSRSLVRLASEDISIDSAGHVRERLRFKQLQGDVAVFWLSGDSAQPRTKFATRQLKLTNPDLELQLALRLDLPQKGSALIDAQGSLDKVHTGRIPAYLPVKVLEKDALTWLDLALENSQGYVPHAAIRLQGALDQFPYFLNNSGQFSVLVDFEHLNLNYAPIPAPGWKPAEKMYGQLIFFNHGLSGTIQRGQIQGVMLDEGTLAIPDFDHPRLALGLKLHGASEQMLDVLKHSPLFKSPKDLDAIQLSGAAKLELNMGIRLDPRDQIPDRVEGWYKPQQARLQTLGLDFTRLNGDLHFVNLDFDSQNLRAELKKNPAHIRVSSHLSSNTPAENRGYHIELDTEAQLSDWLQPAPSILTRLPGRFPLHAKLVLSPDPLNMPNMRLDLSSDLSGLSINFPAPLHKTAPETRPTETQLSFKNEQIELISLRQPDLLEGQFRLGGQRISAGAIHMGKDNYGKAQELKANELRLSGTLDSFNVDEWISALGQNKGQNKGDNDGQENDFLPPTLRISSKINQLHALGSQWDNVPIEGTHNAKGWNIELDAPRISGQIIIPAQATPETPVDIKLSRLMFPEAPPQDNPTPTPLFEPSPLDPGSLPPLHLSIGELGYGDIKLREIDLRAKPQAASASSKGESAWLINPLSAKSTSLSLQGQAAWRRTAEGHPHSRLELAFSSDNVGAALTGLGAKHALRKGILDDTRLSLSWPGGLQQFDWARAHGQGQMHILDGEIDKVELGAGRVLGLISLTELPRRLMLDFGDVFGNGLHFERLDSEMTLNDGKLHSTRFELLSSALKLKVSGFSNMLDQSLHYQMVATPSLGNVLPIVGTVAGGPIIGGATFVAQKLFELAGGSFVTLNYQIGGTWDNPIIERGQAPEALPPETLGNTTEPTPP